MRKGGAITVLIMGILTTILMIITFFVGGMGAAIFSDDIVVQSIFNSSAIGFLLAIGLIILGSVGMGSGSVVVGILTVALCVYGWNLAGGMFASTATQTPIIGAVLIVFMIIGGLGGILSFFGALLERRKKGKKAL